MLFSRVSLLELNNEVGEKRAEVTLCGPEEPICPPSSSDSTHLSLMTSNRKIYCSLAIYYAQRPATT